MTNKARRSISLAAIALILVLGSAGSLQAAGETMYDYTKIPPFIEIGLDPNLLLLIDNSASMYDPAYGAPAGSACYADDFDSATAYSGYFDSTPDTWYKYDFTTDQFEPIAMTGACSSSAAYAHSDLCLILDSSDNVTWVRATGRFWNWLTASKFDVEKEILTGGKYHTDHDELVLESRGCLEERFVKQVPVTKDGDDYFATFGVRPPDSTERTADAAHFATANEADFVSPSSSRIEIFKPTTGGFNASLCQAAITYWADPNANQGTLKGMTEDCVRGTTEHPYPAGNVLMDSHAAFNNIIHECWVYKSTNAFSNGAGSYTSMKNACENVYKASSGDEPPPAEYNDHRPADLPAGDICQGQYDLDAPEVGSTWGTGNVGQCWEEEYGEPLVAAPCPVGAPISYDTAVQDENDYWYFCNASSEYARCSKNSLPACGDETNSNWVVWMVPDPGGTELAKKVYWTDDDGDGGDACVQNAMQNYCREMDDVTVVDPEVNDPLGTAWAVPAVLIGTAAEAQLGQPLKVLKGLLYQSAAPSGLIQEFKYNLRMGAMQFNPGAGNTTECLPVERGDHTYKASLYDCLSAKGAEITASSTALDASQKDGGRIITYIDEVEDNIDELVDAINSITATAWTPLAEAYMEAVGYFTQKAALRLNDDDYICDEDQGDYSDWDNSTFYPAGSKVRFAWDYDVPPDGTTDETKVYYNLVAGTSKSSADAPTIAEDKDLKWTQYDPVEAGCQTNNILIITDGGSTADIASAMATFVTNPSPQPFANRGYNDGDDAVTYADGHTELPINGEFVCKTAADADNLFGSTLMDDLSYYANNDYFPDIFSYPDVEGVVKKKITTYVVSAGSALEDDGTEHECNAKTLLARVASNGGTTLLESNDFAAMERNLRKALEDIGGEPSSGSAASVISNSRSGEGAIFQAVFYPTQQDDDEREITWAGDVHSLWLDELGNIREDCGASCSDPQDYTLIKDVDLILEFFTDPVTSAARARSYTDSDGDGHYTPVDADGNSPDLYEASVSLRDIRYLWSAGEWLSEVTQANVAVHRTYGEKDTKQRHILTSLDGGTMIPFTTAGLRTGILSADAAYQGYFNAATPAEADKIVNYTRGLDQTGYRSRLIDWDGDGTPEYWKLGDIVNSTPTVVANPAEDYDLIYGDPSYQAFRRVYRNRRSMIYAGGNDGGLHAFNGGYYDRASKKFEKGPSGKVQYDLGSEMWMYVPKNLFPHLKWLTEDGYPHVNYIDLKPYIFDAKIFSPDTTHPGGWGTVLVGGMGFGGGNIGVNTDGVAGDEEIMRSAYFILDITDPEVAPAILGEFSHEDLGFTVGSPTAIPMLRCQLKADCTTDWEMDWYLAFPGGPHGPDNDVTKPRWALNGKSDQTASLFVLPLGGTQDTDGLDYVGSYTAADASQFTISAGDSTAYPDLDYSFFSDVIAVDYDLDFKTDSLYFGSVASANLDETKNHTGALHRLKIADDLDPANWVLNTFYKTPGNRPVSGAPSVASDGQRAWIYFGTGRYYSAQIDKSKINDYSQQGFFGLKERYTAAGDMDLTLPNGGNLVDVSEVRVLKGSGDLQLTSGTLPLETTGGDSLTGVDTFAKLNEEMSAKYDTAPDTGLDKYHGWMLDFDLVGERNLGQAAILGNIVTFTSYVPESNICSPEGNSYLWAPFYRTGTAYFKPVMGSLDLGDDTAESLRKVSIGVGLASTPNIHSGGEDGSKAFVQTSTGAIISIEQDNPGVVKSGVVSWREIGD